MKPLSRYIMPIVQQRFSRLMIPDYPISSVTYRSYVWNIISKSKTSFFFSQGLSKIQFCSMRALKALYSVQYMSGFSPHIKDQIKENGSTFNLFFVGEGIHRNCFCNSMRPLTYIQTGQSKLREVVIILVGEVTWFHLLQCDLFLLPLREAII